MSLTHFSDPKIAGMLIESINTYAAIHGPVTIMEVCGTHTMEIGRLSLRSLLHRNISLVSGPGCPVCVTPGGVIDAAAALALKPAVTVLSFGDMVRVPGNRTSLEEAQAHGGSVDIVTSPLQSVSIAKDSPDRNFVFIAVGFETTVPAVARAVELAQERRVSNLTFLVAHRIVPPALNALISDPDLYISAFILPGHVSAVIGVRPYEHLIDRKIPAAITGFEPLDILSGINAICAMLVEQTVAVKNMYPRAVKEEGNPHALALMDRVFYTVDAFWRGIGKIPGSGLALRETFASFDACTEYDITLEHDDMPRGCSCGDVLKGKMRPLQCPLFGNACTPQSPVGPCMVSSEGSCAAYHRYGG